MRTSVFGFLTFICSLKGLSCSQWTMKVQPRVNGSLGENVILPCVFTHPRQNTYNKIITVKWILEKNNELIFHCSLHNVTTGQNGNCTSKSSKQFWLNGDPRNGDISLGINNVKFSDAALYICRVELDYDKFKSYTDLNIYGPARILILSLDLDPKDHGVALKCIAQGKPVPEVKWTSSGPLKNVSVTTYSHIIISSVPFSEQDDYSCQAVNSLGRAQKTFTSHHPNCSGLYVVTGILGCLLSLGLVVFILDVIRRQRAQGVLQHGRCVQRAEASTYQAKESVYANVSPSSVGWETSPVEVYSTGVSIKGEKVEVTPSAPSHRRAPKECPPGPPSARVKRERS